MIHKISAAGLEVDKENISVINTLVPPITVKGVRSFLGHSGFYRRFIKDFSKIARPLCKLLEKDTKFNFNDACKFSFDEIKVGIVIALVTKTPDWNKNFKSCVMLVTLSSNIGVEN